MYPYNYNMYQVQKNMRSNKNKMTNPGYYQDGDRFIPGGFIVPFVLGGVTGGLVANNWRPNNNYYPVQPYPTYYNNYYYPPYGPTFYY